MLFTSERGSRPLVSRSRLNRVARRLATWAPPLLRRLRLTLRLIAIHLSCLKTRERHLPLARRLLLPQRRETLLDGIPFPTQAIIGVRDAKEVLDRYIG